VYFHLIILWRLSSFIYNYLLTRLLPFPAFPPFVDEDFPVTPFYYTDIRYRVLLNYDDILRATKIATVLSDADTLK
jgi:hypothetical protein